MDENLNRAIWIGLIITILVAVIIYIARPTYQKIKEQKEQIETIDYSTSLNITIEQPIYIYNSSDLC